MNIHTADIIAKEKAECLEAFQRMNRAAGAVQLAATELKIAERVWNSFGSTLQQDIIDEAWEQRGQ